MVRDTSSTSVCYWRWVRCSASPGPQYLPSVQKGWLCSVQVPGGVHVRLWWTWAVCRPWSTKLVQSYSPTNKDPLWSHGEWVMLSMKWRSRTGEEPQRGYQLNLLKMVMPNSTIPTSTTILHRPREQIFYGLWHAIISCNLSGFLIYLEWKGEGLSQQVVDVSKLWAQC